MSVLTVEKANRVAWVTIQRPEKLNALNQEVLKALDCAFAGLEHDADVGVVVLTGSGEKAFVAGADIGELKELDSASARVLALRGQAVFQRIEDLSKPVIAAVNGFALGGGCELALACDMIVASESAVFGQPEINLGVIPGFGGSQRLTRLVGKNLALEMVLLDRRLTADEAQAVGLANHVVPVETYLDEALKLAARIAAQAPLAVRLGKEAVKKSMELSLSEGLALERRLFQMLFASSDQKEGMAAFIEKRKAQWTGR